MVSLRGPPWQVLYPLRPLESTFFLGEPREGWTWCLLRGQGLSKQWGTGLGAIAQR